jgi:hypothetical protein
MNAKQLVAAATLASLLLADCASHSSAMPPVAQRGVVTPQIFQQQGGSRWTMFSIPDGGYSLNASTAQGFDNAVWFCGATGVQGYLYRIDLNGGFTSSPLDCGDLP